MKKILFILISTSIYCQSYLNDLLIINDSTLIAVGRDGYILRTNDGGKNWINRSIQTSENFIRIRGFGRKLWIKTYLTDRILFSENFGESWEQIYQLDDGCISDIYFVNDTIGFMTGSGWQICTTSDGGKSWKRLEGSYSGGGEIYFIDELHGWISGHNGFYSTVDGGKKWMFNDLESYDLNNIKIYFLNQKNGFITGTGWSNNDILYGLYAYTIDGSSWSKYSLDLLWTSDIYFSSPEKGWITNNERILYTTNKGSSWDSIFVSVRSFEFIHDKSWGLSNGDQILFSDDGWQSWKQQHPKATSVSNHPLYTDYRLFQNYPNPFNPVTHIKYLLKNDSMISIEVYDILGHQIETLVNQFKAAGDYNLIFDAKNLSSGIYLIKMKADNFSATKKMILMR